MKKIKEILSNKNNYKYILSFVLVIVLLVMVGGISYAMFDYSRTGTKENVITTGQITVAFEEQNNIKLQNRYAETDAQGLANTDRNSRMTFTVSSNITGGAIVNYAVGLVDIQEGETLTTEFIKIYLEKNGVAAPGFYENQGYLVSNFRTKRVEGYINKYVIAHGNVIGTQTDTYTLKAWIDENYDLLVTDTSGGKEHSNKTLSETFSFKIKVVAIQEINLDTSEANVPQLASNMIPVYYDEQNDLWRKADSLNANSQYQWYDYNNKMWANAVTVTEENGTRDDLLDAPLGTPILMDRINTMLVWIPRFSATGDALNYNGGTEENPGAFDITFVSKDTAAHDAFTFGEQKLSGFWVGKFKNSSDTECTPETNSSLYFGCNHYSIRPKVLPNQEMWRGASVLTFFKCIQGMTLSENQYGFDKTIDTSIDTHLLKNNEWGAVAYLTHSIYGRCSSKTECSKIGINNNGYTTDWKFLTGYGAPAGSLEDYYGTYETTLGMNASTTGNIYGVYDMSSEINEYVMGNYDNAIGQAQSSLPDAKYYNVYTNEDAYNSAGLQHALYETEDWYEYNNRLGFVLYSTPWYIRGHYQYNGIFYFSDTTGRSDEYNGSRISISIN